MRWLLTSKMLAASLFAPQLNYTWYIRTLGVGGRGEGRDTKRRGYDEQRTLVYTITYAYLTNTPPRIIPPQCFGRYYVRRNTVAALAPLVVQYVKYGATQLLPSWVRKEKGLGIT